MAQKIISSHKVKSKFYFSFKNKTKKTFFSKLGKYFQIATIFDRFLFCYLWHPSCRLHDNSSSLDSNECETNRNYFQIIKQTIHLFESYACLKIIMHLIMQL